MTKSNVSRGKKSPRLTDHQGLELVRRALDETCPCRPKWSRELGVSFEDWSNSITSKPLLSLADGITIRRLQDEGPWRLLAEILRADRTRTTSLIAALDAADRRLAAGKDGDFGRRAVIEVITTLRQFADVPLRRMPTIDHLLNAIADAQNQIPNAFWVQWSQGRDGKPIAGAAVAEFTGELAGLIQILAGALGPKKLTEARSGHAGHDLRRLAQKRAQQLGIPWTKTTAESLHARVVGPSRGKAVEDDPSLIFDWRRLSEARVFDPFELGRYARERLQFLEVIRAARGAVKRGEDLKDWCLRRAEIVFALERSPPKAPD